MKKLLILGGLGAVAAALARKRRRIPDFTHVDTANPQRTVQSMEASTDVPGGVRP
ncbi:MAG TPA: hypothetical protein VJ456_19110 [Acidimicrobiia bacterium]|nr:hypothetical protein [Acidimicrobiia bacterium]